MEQAREGGNTAGRGETNRRSDKESKQQKGERSAKANLRQSTRLPQPHHAPCTNGGAGSHLWLYCWQDNSLVGRFRRCDTGRWTGYSYVITHRVSTSRKWKRSSSWNDNPSVIPRRHTSTYSEKTK
eukprot:scaffold1001_cov191-Alexandrium_tamarense.AAC.4